MNGRSLKEVESYIIDPIHYKSYEMCVYKIQCILVSIAVVTVNVFI